MPTWTEQLPEALRTEANLEIFNKHETIGDFAKHLLETNQNLSAITGEKSTLEGKLTDLTSKMGDMYAIPGENTSPEDKMRYLKAIGVPEKAEEYGLEGDMGQTFLDLGFSKTQATAFVENMKKANDSEQLKVSEKIKSAVKAYDDSLGDKKELTYKLANDAVSHFYSEDKREDVRASIFNSPEMIEVNAKIGALLKERPGMFSVQNNNRGGGNLYETMGDLK